MEAVLKETTDINNFADWLLTLLVAKRGGVLYLPVVANYQTCHENAEQLRALQAWVREMNAAAKQ